VLATKRPAKENDMDRTYNLKLHRDERVGALLQAQLYRITDDGRMKLAAEVDDSHSALGIGDVFEAFPDQLVIYQDKHGQLP
jgi:hypothetical protein